VPGEGVTGLSDALLSAGAGSVVTSLWDIDDQAAAAFMSRFYQALERQPIAAALQDTQAALIRSRRWGHPAYWAAFSVAGQADARVQLEPTPWGGRWALGFGAAAGAALLGAWHLRRQRRRTRAPVLSA